MAERWDRVKEMFSAALERAPADRAAFLDEACGTAEGDIRREVEALLAAHQESDGFLETPATAMVSQPPPSYSVLAEARLAAFLGARYTLEGLLGRGGMGAVYKAKDNTLERPVAIKVMAPELAMDDTVISRFEREARIAAKLDHPGIIPVFSVEKGDGMYFFVMKYVQGKGLDELIRSGPLPITLCQRILWECATALGHAHQRGVVHRDIKPANIMLDEADRVVITDFGISKATQATTQLTATGQILGTPYYMSPEQAKGLDIDGRGDQYSLAMAGYHMLTGQVPFGDFPVYTVIYKQIFEALTPIPELRPDAPEILINALEKAMAKEPEDRFATMEDFATATLPERPVIATGGTRRVTRPTTMKRPRSRMRIAIIVGVSVLAVLALAWMLWLSTRNGATSTLARAAIVPRVRGDSAARSDTTPGTRSLWLHLQLSLTHHQTARGRPLASRGPTRPIRLGGRLGGPSYRLQLPGLCHLRRPSDS